MKEKMTYIVSVGMAVLVVAIAALVCVKFIDVNKKSDYEVESGALAYVEEEATRDVGEVVGKMQSVDQSYSESQSVVASESESVKQSEEESRQQSEAESIAASVAESIAESKKDAAEESLEAEEQASIDASIAESVAESIAESQAQSIAESESAERASKAAEGTLKLGNLAQGQINTIGVEDIPYIRQLFANTVVIGDSRAKGSVDCGVLSENEVSYYGGASCGTLFETTAAGAYKMRSKALFIVGLNDLGFYGGDANLFIEDFGRLVDSYLAINPNSTIYVQDILPVQEFGRFAWPYMDYRPTYNEALRNFCAERGYTFVEVADYATANYVNSEDGAHFGLEFYLIWAQAVANQMGLWEDL